MFRRIVGGFALAAVVATGASAQAFQVGSPTTDGFSFVSATPHEYDSFRGQFNIDDPNTGVGTSVFQVFCVDPNHLVTAGETYNVWVTPLSVSPSDFNHTRVPAGEPTLYAEAAALASNMLTGNTNTQVQNENYAYAMWTILGYTFNQSDGYDQTMVDADIAYAQANVGHVTLNQWLVITVDPIGDASGPQEFLYNTTGRPEEGPTPEPGTMAMMATGLVGMAGAGIRRRRRNK